MKKNLLVVLCSLAFAPVALAQTWDGSAGTNWNTPANWSTNAIPLTTGNVIIPGGLTNYPILANAVTINNLDMRAGSQLDFNGFNLTITSAINDFTTFVGATLNNSNAAADIVVNITSGPGYHTYIRSTTVNDNITFNINGPANFYDADNAGTGNHYTGNLIINFDATGTLYLSQSDTSFYDENLIVNRTAAGNTDAFNSGGVIGGNFSFTNNAAGNSLFGIAGRRTSIAGTVNIAINDTTPGSFELINLVNQTGGGSINVQNSLGFDVRNDTLIVSAFSVTGYRGSDFGYLLDNAITGNVTIADNAAHTAGYHTYLRGNEITGNTSFTVNSNTNLYEADNTSTGNHYTGNVNFSVTGTGTLYLSQSDTSFYDGNLTINRTGAGNTDAFNSGGVIGGNFSFTNNAAGNSLFGIAGRRTSIAGTVNIAINDTTPGSFELIHLVNQTGGGSINVQNSLGFDVRNDTLIVSVFSVTGYRGSDFGYLLDNAITGNVTIADNAAHTAGYHTYIRGNEITGNTSFTVNSNTNLYEADNTSTGNHYTGNVNFSVTGTGTLYLSQSDTSFYDGNLTVNRTGAGNTDAFNSGGVIGGNFSFTNAAAGNSLFGIATNRTSIAGTVNITINDTTAGSFELIRLVNQTGGGSINVQNSRGFDIRNDTLIVNTFSVTGYRGADFGTLYNNDITGNVTIADDVTHTAGYHTYVRENEITGNTSFTINSTTNLYESDNAGTGNHYTGNVNVTVAGTGALYLSQSDTSFYDGNLVINRTGAGTTDAFNSGGVIGGNFSFTNNAAGNSLFGIAGRRTSIAGTVNIVINDTTAGSFELIRVVNQTGGGSINVQNSRGFDIRNDTLMVNALSVTGYQGADFGYLFDNDITGNVTIADDAAHTAGYHTYIRGNDITGNSSFTINSTTNLYDADNAATGNKYMGNVSYARNGGNISVGSGDTTEISQNLTLNSTSNITLVNIKFNGATNGIIEQLGVQPVITTLLVMEKTGTGTITLNDSVTVSASLFFNGGNIVSSTAGMLIFLDNATHSGASAASHVAGPVTKNGNDVFTFPTGTVNTLNPVTMTAPAAGSVFSAQYINSNASNDGYDTSMRAATLLRVSGCEYWDIQRVAGTSNVSLNFGFGEPCVFSTYITDPAKIHIAHWTGSIWEDLGNGGSTGTTSGTISTAGPVSNFSPFTFGSVDIIANPLPVKLLTFTATAKREIVYLQWKTENEINFSHFEVEKSKDGSHFTSIGILRANNNPVTNQYALQDDAPFKGINFYRLKMVDKNGKSAYSKIETILFNSFSAISIFPNPAKDEIKILSSKNIMSLEITDVSGKLVKRMVAKPDNRYNVNDLQPGIYLIRILDEEKTHVAKLLIQ